MVFPFIGVLIIGHVELTKEKLEDLVGSPSLGLVFFLIGFVFNAAHDCVLAGIEDSGSGEDEQDSSNHVLDCLLRYFDEFIFGD
jgi:hypothetical protein